MNADLQKKKRKENESSEKRSPLLDFNKIPKFTTKRSNNSAASSSSSSSSSIGASKSCLRVLLSSNNSASASSKSAPRKQPTSFFSTKSGNLKSKSSKENILPRPISEKPKKNTPSLYQWHSGKKPVSRTSQKSKLCADLSNSAKNPRSGSEQVALNREDLKRAEHKNGSGKQPIQLFNLDNSFSSFENRTPVGKLASGSGLDYANFVGENVEEELSAKSNTSIVKTPPIEASVSPEVPYGLSAVLASAATPCYGAGHILSGVTDKRKCRPRGVLTVGPVLDSSMKCWKADESNKESFNSGVHNKSRTSFVPLPAEASMCWLSSPCREGDGIRKSGSASQFQGLMGSATLELPPTTSLCCEMDSDLDCDGSAAGKTSFILHSPRKSELQELSRPSYEKNDRNLSSSPQTMPSCKAFNLHQVRNCSGSFVMDSSPHSTSTLSCGNVIQTPKSDSSSAMHFGLSWFNVDEHRKPGFEYELDEVTEILRKASLSPQNQMPTRDAPEMSFKFTNSTSPFGFVGIAECQKHRDAAASLLSDSSFGNASESNMRISWRDGLVSRTIEMDELDRCRCLSDEENDNVCCTNDQIKSNQSFEGSAYEENDLVMKSVLKSPELLKEEPCIYKNGKEKLSPQRPSSCAESIFTDGGGLVSSADSDWTLCCKSQQFQI